MKHELIDQLSQIGQTKNLVLGLNIHTDRQKVKCSKFDRINQSQWRAWRDEANTVSHKNILINRLGSVKKPTSGYLNELNKSQNEKKRYKCLGKVILIF